MLTHSASKIPILFALKDMWTSNESGISCSFTKIAIHSLYKCVAGISEKEVHILDTSGSLIDTLSQNGRQPQLIAWSRSAKVLATSWADGRLKYHFLFWS
jgi:hypothetical protein